MLAAIELLSETGRGDLQKLHGRDERWRLRVGDWRVILTFDYSNNTFTVRRVLHRREAYRRR